MEFDTIGYCEVNNKLIIKKFNSTFAKLVKCDTLKRYNHISNIKEFDLVELFENALKNKGSEITGVSENYIFKVKQIKNKVKCFVMINESIDLNIPNIIHTIRNKLNYLIGGPRDNIVHEISKELEKLSGHKLLCSVNRKI